MKFDSSHAECSVPWLNEVLVLFTVALQLCQQLKDKVGARETSEKSRGGDSLPPMFSGRTRQKALSIYPSVFSVRVLRFARKKQSRSWHANSIIQHNIYTHTARGYLRCIGGLVCKSFALIRARIKIACTVVKITVARSGVGRCSVGVRSVCTKVQHSSTHRCAFYGRARVFVCFLRAPVIISFTTRTER